MSDTSMRSGNSGSLNFFTFSFGATEGGGSSGGGGGIPEAPLDGQSYARKMATWTALPPNSGNSGIPDAPSNGQQYGRQDGAWTPIVHEGGDSGIPDAPSNGLLYGRQDGAWEQIIYESEGGGIPDAPYDDVLYGRKNGIWTRVPESSGGGEITGLYPEIVAGTTTPVTVGESTTNVAMYTIPGSIIDAAVGSVLTIDILAYGALDAGYRELSISYEGYSIGFATVTGAKSVGLRFAVYVADDAVHRLPAGFSPYMASTGATSARPRVAGRGVTVQVVPGETGILTMNACIVTKWRAPA